MYRGDHHSVSSSRYHHHVPHEHFLRRPLSALPPPPPSTASQPELFRGVGSSAPTSHHVCSGSQAPAPPPPIGSSNQASGGASSGGGGPQSGSSNPSTLFQHSPGCPHTGGPSHHPHQHSHDVFQSYSGDLCRSVGDGSHVYTDIIGPRGHEMHHDSHSHDHHDHHEQFHRHSSPQDMVGPRSDMYREMPNPHMGHGHHHHHHHHHSHGQHQQARHSSHMQSQSQSSLSRQLMRHTSNLDRQSVERHRPNLERRGLLEPRREYDSDDQLREEPVHHGEMLRHHRSVPDMYATLQAEERQLRHQHTYGAGCRLRRQQSLSKETSMSGTSAASDPPAIAPPPPSSRRLAGLQRQHSLGQELPRSYTHDLFGSDQQENNRQTQDLTRSQSSVQDLSRVGSVGLLGSADIRRSRSTIQEVRRSGRATSEERELRHAHSTHDLPRSHSPRSPRRGTTRNVSSDMYPEATHASSGGSSGPSPPLPQNLSDNEGFPRHSAHCELSRSQQQLHMQQQQHQPRGLHNYYHVNVPPPPPNRVSHDVYLG